MGGAWVYLGHGIGQSWSLNRRGQICSIGAYVRLDMGGCMCKCKYVHSATTAARLQNRKAVRYDDAIVRLRTT